MQVYKIDGLGFYVGPVWLNDGQALPDDCRTDQPQGFFKAKRNADDTGWIEGASQEEIENAKNSNEKTQFEILKETVDQLVLDNLMRG